MRLPFHYEEGFFMQNQYIGHNSQLCSVEEVRLVGGKGDGMRLIQVRNAAGLEFTVSADRCADLSRVIFKGDNMGYFGPCGYVAPSYYQESGEGFLKSFTCGFLTTCGLTTVGDPQVDEGEELPLHGTIGNTPCEHIWWEETADQIIIHARINDSGIFSRKLYLIRTITCGKFDNTMTITDRIENQGDTPSPLMLLYHFNMGYPLLSEHSILDIPSETVTPRTEHAAEDLDTWNKVLTPQPCFEEQCYYHTFTGQASASLSNPDIKKGLEIYYDAENLKYFTQWKMMGVRDYTMGLEPGNSIPDGRSAMKELNDLTILQPGEAKEYQVNIRFFEL